MKLLTFAAGILVGLWRSLSTDIDVFLLGLSGLLLGLPWRMARAFAKALLLYTTFRRLDSYVTALRFSAVRARDENG